MLFFTDKHQLVMIITFYLLDGKTSLQIIIKKFGSIHLKDPDQFEGVTMQNMDCKNLLNFY